MLEANKIVHGDALQVLQSYPDGSVDLAVTDPPYGYSFMGKDWDKAVPPVAIWRELLRTLKHGSFAFVMSAPRQDVLSRMVVNLQDAGFRTDFTPIYWAYASGFPKAMNISKAVDKKLGFNREVVATIKKTHLSNENTNEGWKRPSHEGKTTMDITVAFSVEAKLLDGSFGGFQPKPAVEVILVAMKPLSEKTFVDQALANGKGVTWLDNTRIPIGDGEKVEDFERSTGGFSANSEIYSNSEKYQLTDFNSTLKGRFPANLLCSDDCLNDGIERKSPSGLVNRKPKNGEVFNASSCGFDNTANHDSGFGDEGSFSRYFSLDAWFDKQLRKLPLEVQKTFPFLIEPKASKDERNKNCEKLSEKDAGCMNGTITQSLLTGSGNIRNNKAKNNHPCVKPLQLMSYLITLGSRSNDLIIDPFCGSGTTCLAAKMLGRQFIGIELNAEYVEIAEKRVGNHRTLFEFASVEPLKVASLDDKKSEVKI